MTRDEYWGASQFVYESSGRQPLPYETLARGGIVGRCNLVDCVTTSESPWFCGPFGFVLADVESTPFVPCRGALGFWEVPAELAKLAVEP
jgi:hypothetical protein